MKALAILSVFLALPLWAQIAKPTETAKTTDVVVKDTPASQSLQKLAKEEADDQAAFNTKVQQANFNYSQNNKVLNDSITKTEKELDAKIRADKKYKTLVDQITNLQKQLADTSQKIKDDFQKETEPVQQKLNTESEQVQALVPVVRKENNLPDSATFDSKTGKWTVSSETAKK